VGKALEVLLTDRYVVGRCWEGKKDL